MRQKTEGFYMRLSPEDRAALDQLKQREQRSASAVIRGLVAEAARNGGHVAGRTESPARSESRP